MVPSSPSSTRSKACVFSFTTQAVECFHGRVLGFDLQVRVQASGRSHGSDSNKENSVQGLPAGKMNGNNTVYCEKKILGVVNMGQLLPLKTG